MGVIVVIVGDNLPSLVGIGLTDLPNLEGRSSPCLPIPTALAWVLHEEADQKIFSQVSCHTMRLLNLV